MYSLYDVHVFIFKINNERRHAVVFRKLRNAALAIGAVGTTIISAPAALPVVLVKIAGYMAVAGSAAAVVSQTVTGKEKEEEKDDHGQ